MNNTHSMFKKLFTAVVLLFVCASSAVAIDKVVGVYQIGTAQDLKDFADIVNGANGQNKNLSASAVLTADINLGGESGGSWTSMGTSGAKYQGTFDGGGHTISGFYQSFSGRVQGSGLFGYTSGAKIQNFKISGDAKFTGTDNSSYFLSTVVGNGTGTTIEDVSSSVNMTFTGGSEQTRIIGGIAGRNDGIINRCRYNGTISLGERNIQKVAGICASSNGVTITNCLFDGSIISSTSYTAADKVIVGGILGYDESKKTSIAFCVSIGKITLSNSPVSTNVGAVWGQNAGNQVTTSNVYYTTENITKNSSNLDQSGGSNNSGTNATNGLIPLATAGNRDNQYWENLRNTLKSENWHIETESGAPAYPIPGKTTDCDHSYSESGWCKKCEARKPLEQASDGTYLIGCLAQFASFRDLVNKSAGAELNAKFTADMDFNLYLGYLGEPIGYDAKNPYHGTFDGDGHSIIAVHIDGRHDNIGQFGYIKNATIKKLNIAGDINIYTDCNYVGSIAGFAYGECHFEDISSAMNLNLDAQDDEENPTYHNVKVIGGIVGHIENTNTTINRCRFGGTVSAQKSYDRIGGIVGETANGHLSNVLFDGNIIVDSPESDVIVGGLVGQLTGSTNSIKNSLSHGTINQSSDKAGAILGYADNKPLTIDRLLYTECGKVKSAYGSARTGNIITTNAYPWDITVSGTCKKLSDGEAYLILSYVKNDDIQSEANWKQLDGAAYPVPCNVTNTHSCHSYNSNGFCKANDENYQSVEGKDTDGYYAVSNAGQLWWIAGRVNSGELKKDIRIKLTSDIDLEGEKHGSFVGMCHQVVVDQHVDWEQGFRGIFDGQGHTINNYYTDQSGIRIGGLFNIVKDATIRNFSINGRMVANSNANLQGAVVGSASGTSIIEDVFSSVNIDATSVVGVGGIAGTLENSNNQPLTIMNRCRYNGEINIHGSSSNKGIGGLCGQLRCAIITNCLFDGSLHADNNSTYTFVGGLVGLVEYPNCEIHRVLSNGIIDLPNYDSSSPKAGIVVGGANKTLLIDKSYHITTGSTSGLTSFGPSTSIVQTDSETGMEEKVDVSINLILGESTDITNSAEMPVYSESLLKELGRSNWTTSSFTQGNYPYPKKELDHEHHFVNGFCDSGDGEYEKPTLLGYTYHIDNGGKLYWFAEHFNSGEICEISIDNNETKQPVSVVITADIDMDGYNYTFPGIGNITHKFSGTFDGQGYKITRFHRDIINSEYTGLINYADNATIKCFSIYGEISFNLSIVKSYHGTVVGYALGPNTTIEDVVSSVDVDMGNHFVRVFGGIAGRASGVINRCSYKGTMNCKGSGRQIAGICANAKERLSIDNCLFEGTINSTCSTADTMRVSGILASNEKKSGVTIVIKNCLFNGCLNLKHTYVQSEEDAADKKNIKSTENGIIAGYWDSNFPKTLNNVFYLKKCAQEMEGLGVGKFEGENQRPGSTIAIESISENPTEADWMIILNKLNEVTDENPSGTGNWVYDPSLIGIGSPVGPNAKLNNDAQVCAHKKEDNTWAVNEFGWCTLCGKRRPLQTIEEDNKTIYLLEYIADLSQFRDLVNSGTAESRMVLNARMIRDIDFVDFPGELGEPIGNSKTNRYLYNFDGQGHSIKNIRVTANQEYVGMFGFAGDTDHSCYIHDFTITGYINVPYQSSKNEDKPLYAGVVGKMYNGKIENVHSQMAISNSNLTQIVLGGILGSAESEDESNSVVIDKCSYIGSATINGYGDLGGIVGRVSSKTVIKNCTFAGSMNHIYDGDIMMTQFGGIAGYNESEAFSGIQNCVIAGVIKTKTSDFKQYGIPGNHKNVLCGEDKIITNLTVNNISNEDYTNHYSGNYAWNAYQSQIPESVVSPVFVSLDKFVNGDICALMNALDDQPTDVQNGHPWGQIIGYQIGDVANGQLNGPHTTGSPAQRVPFPGYQNHEKTIYKVVADASKNYTIDYMYLDDNGDTTPMPSDAASVTAKRVVYTRSKDYLKGEAFLSVCLPFALTNEILPTSDCVVKDFDRIETKGEVKTVYLKDVIDETHTAYEAGKPYFIYLPTAGKKDWTINLTSETGIALTPANPTPANGESHGIGIFGSFNSIKTGAWANTYPCYKLNVAGTGLVKSGESSLCYPYRAYMVLEDLSTNSSSSYRLSFDAYEEGEANGVEQTIEENSGEVRCYNLQGQQVGRNSKGLLVRNGKIVIR